jgi:hypothetical protein
MDFEDSERRRRREKKSEPREPVDPLIQWGIVITGLWVLMFLFEAAFREEVDWLAALLG